MSPNDKDLVWLHGEVRTPPFSAEARFETGFLLRQLQQGMRLSMPQSAQYHRLAVDAMSCGSTMKTAPGGLYIELMTTQL